MEGCIGSAAATAGKHWQLQGLLFVTPYCFSHLSKAAGQQTAMLQAVKDAAYRATWSPARIADQAGRVFIITGANSGLGERGVGRAFGQEPPPPPLPLRRSFAAHAPDAHCMLAVLQASRCARP